MDNWRWADTPFYVRTGKRLARRETTIAIQFQRAPHPPFEDAATEELKPNRLLVHVQPDEGVSLAIAAKVPGQGMRLRTVNMDFIYGGAFRTDLPEAYERLLLDAMLGDQTLFTRSDEVEEQWSIVDAIVAAWKRDRPAFPNYAAGTWGPAAAKELMTARRPGVAQALSAAPVHAEEWVGEDVALADVERALWQLRDASAEGTEGPDLRTSVMTHLAWVPAEWREAAVDTLAGLRERHPSRGILLFPGAVRSRRDRREGLRARLPAARGSGATSRPRSIELTLRGGRVSAPASIVTPLLVSDLPVFLRWRGELPFGAPELEQMVGVCDRLVVDSREWKDAAGAYRELEPRFEQTAVSDIAWRCTWPWRRALAGLWPGIAEAGELRVTGSSAEALLLVGWLRSRLGTTHRAGARGLHIGSSRWPWTAQTSLLPRDETSSSSDLLSAELDELSRDEIYEDAVGAASA